jgi:ABC-type transport system involved in multi-copper enzyme maturation permease subunit
MLKAILWKEWREQRWKLAFGTVMLLFFTGSFLAARVTSNKETVLIICGFGGILLTIYSAMGVFAPEHINRTKNFLISKPVQPWKTFLCKWFFGWLNFTVPILVSTLGFILVVIGDQGMREFTLHKFLQAPICMVAFATMYYTLVCGLAPRKTGEAGVGLTGLLVFVGLVIYGMIISTPKNPNPLQYFNPFEILGFLDPVPFEPKFPLFFLAQSSLFALAVILGYQKWKRSL